MIRKRKFSPCKTKLFSETPLLILESESASEPEPEPESPSGKNRSKTLPTSDTLPAIGKSRFSQFKKFLPISREKFRQLSKEGKAPQPERMGIRCTFYSNSELHRWLDDPINYHIDQ